jgi:tripartite-type tricarboxylate transporter receptor subunit TctC
LFANIKMLHVPFAGDTPAITAVLSGDVDIGIVAVASGGNFVTGGKLKAFGVGGPTRLKALPDVPTVIEETGFKEFTGYTWNVLVAAKGTPPDVIEKLNAALNEISAKPEVIEKLANVGLRTLPGDVKTIAGFVAGEAANYKRVIELTGVKRE